MPAIKTSKSAKQDLQLVNFNKGLITEANPLNQPLGSTRDEQNFTLQQDGVRSRRLGMDYEVGAVEQPSFMPGYIGEAATNTFRWDLTGSHAGLYIVVVQVGQNIHLFRSTEAALSSDRVDVRGVSLSTDVVFSMTQVNSLLVVATGEEIFSLEYDSEQDDFIKEEIILEVRDFFGVEDVDPVTGKHIDRGNELNFRPPVPEEALREEVFNYTSPEHFYNLFNQGWPADSTLNLSFGSKVVSDYMLRLWEANGFVPSNADAYAEFVVSSTDVEPRHAEAFTPETMISGLLKTFEAPKGRFILDLLDRGSRRGEVYEAGDLISKGEFTPPLDRTTGSASVVAEFAGRVFYAGFNGETIDGDDKSPTLNNYVAFSQLVSYKQQTSQCYQVADPTSAEDSEIVATDGGFIRISGATNIVGLVSVSNSLLVFATNGVWQILGGSDFGFSAENYQVVKVSERGCISPKSLVEVSGSVFYWASDGIYLAKGSESGFFVSEDVTKATIKSHYSGITDKTNAKGIYDDFNRTVRWLCCDGEELVLKLDFGAWTVNKIAKGDLKVKGIVEVSPFIGGQEVDPVVVLGEQIVVGGEDVAITTNVSLTNRVEVKYLVIRPDNDTFTFSSYNNTEFIDWDSVSTFGVDADAYMQGSHFTGGSGAKSKQSPYITFHFNKTESGFDAEFEPLTPSSCLVQTSWDWSNNINSGKQGREFQAYRFRRHYIPETSLDGFDNGYETVTTKSKVRGRGKALSVKVSTEPSKDCRLIGWEQEVTINET